MQLDTNQLKGRIDSEVERIKGRIEALRQEIQNLEGEKSRLAETFKAVEAVERIARELDVLNQVDLQARSERDSEAREEHRSVAPDPEASSAYSEEEEKPSERIHDFKQWA
ncbi:MAG TPA: hypothetical protein VLU25_04155 [Acidobacteriota bacterium]|nr:hypothetical protein [Acidobacteriota bacterium]